MAAKNLSVANLPKVSVVAQTLSLEQNNGEAKRPEDKISPQNEKLPVLQNEKMPDKKDFTLNISMMSNMSQFYAHGQSGKTQKRDELRKYRDMLEKLEVGTKEARKLKQKIAKLKSETHLPKSQSQALPKIEQLSQTHTAETVKADHQQQLQPKDVTNLNSDPKKGAQPNSTQPKKRPRFKTQFRVFRTDRNISALENLLCQYIQKDKTLLNTNELEIMGDPNNRFQQSMKRFKEIEEILPYSKIVKQNYGFDEANLNKNSLVLEKVILQRLAKTKLQRQENRQRDAEIKSTIAKDLKRK